MSAGLLIISKQMTDISRISSPPTSPSRTPAANKRKRSSTKNTKQCKPKVVKMCYVIPTNWREIINEYFPDQKWVVESFRQLLRDCVSSALPQSASRQQKKALQKAIVCGTPSDAKSKAFIKVETLTRFFSSTTTMFKRKLKKLKTETAGKTSHAIQQQAFDTLFRHKKFIRASQKEIKDTKTPEGVTHISNEQMYGKGSNSKKGGF